MRAHRHLLTAAAVAALTAAFAAAGTEALAQTYYDDGTYVDEFVVTGPARRDGPSRLSQVVNIRDLDLNTYAGREVMRLRVRDTARNICRILGEGPGNGGPLLRSCEQDAIAGARPQMRVAVAQARARVAYAYLDAYPWDTRVFP